jgi:hypothetical protein
VSGEAIMANAGSQDFELEDSFEDDAPFENDDSSKAVNHTKNSLTKRRLVDDLLEEKRLQRRLKEYDFEFDDDLDDPSA